ncbi:MAG: AAA family ATPase [Candidatus Riflebacteria bacterium]|nr:AAA family ATPase [Candidatus Riflebacteria bacterium]
MLTRLAIRRFKCFGDVDIELGNTVVFIGPNNSGKTTALQALALWNAGARRWLSKRSGKEIPRERIGVTLNRKDLLTLPVPAANLLWKDLHVRRGRKNGRKGTENVRMEICVEGILDGKEWSCGLEFDYANEESFYCRPLRPRDAGEEPMDPVPPHLGQLCVAFLPPMSGLASNETRLDPGAIQVRLGEGRTAEVLRNLCYQVTTVAGGETTWARIRDEIDRLFLVRLQNPVYVPQRGEIELSYETRGGIPLDISCAGRGLQQTLLILAHLALNPDSVLLFDEPDAHLEILRQRHAYQLLTEWARDHNSQILMASHSEVILNEAASTALVVAFLGKPHRIDDRGSQLRKSLQEIGYDQYYQAEQTGWVLYLENSTDLEILRVLARKLNHPAQDHLRGPFTHYVETNLPQRARDHFFGLKEAYPNLVGFALFDRIDNPLVRNEKALFERKWARREIENYICTPDCLRRWARAQGLRFGLGPVVEASLEQAMDAAISEVEKALATLKKPSPWSTDLKVSDDFLEPLFEKFYEILQVDNLMRKSAYHELAAHLDVSGIDQEVVSVLDDLVAVARRASPVTAEEDQGRHGSTGLPAI